ncbi:hypothetical protein PR001_g31021 [Phytophthora rubi]|uniref:Uncharacterized protein n=1 Tax=Phytophthora rubi TaxID=129364 RepID=A0A6A3GJC1_9STRA|nr:hypothetical protein PR001_g31021 [Phytophthora rubi]
MLATWKRPWRFSRSVESFAMVVLPIRSICCSMTWRSWMKSRQLQLVRRQLRRISWVATRF